MRTHAFRWTAWGIMLALSTGVLAAQSGRGSSGRGGFGSLDSAAVAGERGSSVAGPTLGYVVDATAGNLYMVNGIAGSSTMGTPIRHGSAITASAVSSSADYAVIADETGAAWFYGEPGPRGASRLELEGLRGVTHLAVSPTGDAIAAYAAGSGSLAVFAVVNGIPRVERTYTAAVSAPAVRVAIADGLKDPVLITHDASGSTLLRAGADGVRSLAVLPEITDAVFLRGSERMLLLDASQKAVYEADLGSPNPTLALIASSAQGIDAPVGLAVSGDNRTAAVANGSNRTVTLVDLATRQATQFEVPEAPSGIRRMNSRAVFQLTNAGNGPVLLLDAQDNSARAVYVPAYAGGRGAASGRARLE